MTTIYNFNPGPAVLPRPVLEQAQAELLDYQGTGMSILEVSHRGEEYEQINADAQARIKRLIGLGEEYHVLFLGGGASTQFAMVPLNYLCEGTTADYILTGTWGEKARDEAMKVGQVHIAATTRAEKYCRVPQPEEIHLSDDPVYVHMTTNNTIHGTQWQWWPEVGDARLVADMSSDILSRSFEAKKFSLIYAGAQKNLGPAGVTVVIVRSDWLEEASESIPTILRYATHAKAGSLYNTPPVFAVYMLNLTLGWIESSGGVDAMHANNLHKAAVIYDAIDSSNSYYRGHAAPDSRSLMNVTFRLPDEDMEKRFIAEAADSGYTGLAGHRSLGGIRASLYNAMTIEGATALAEFMADFTQRHG